MADEREKRERDGFASGMRGTDINEAAKGDPMTGVTGGERTYLPGSGAAEPQGTAASSREGTQGAVGEMDITGAPAGAASTGGSGESEGGGTGGGARSSGGTGPGTSASGGPQTARSTLERLGDGEPDASAGGRGADVASDDAQDT